MTHAGRGRMQVSSRSLAIILQLKLRVEILYRAPVLHSLDFRHALQMLTLENHINCVSLTPEALGINSGVCDLFTQPNMNLQ